MSSSSSASRSVGGANVALRSSADVLENPVFLLRVLRAVVTRVKRDLTAVATKASAFSLADRVFGVLSDLLRAASQPEQWARVRRGPWAAVASSVESVRVLITILGRAVRCAELKEQATQGVFSQLRGQLEGIDRVLQETEQTLARMSSDVPTIDFIEGGALDRLTPKPVTFPLTDHWQLTRFLLGQHQRRSLKDASSAQSHTQLPSLHALRHNFKANRARLHKRRRVLEERAAVHAGVLASPPVPGQVGYGMRSPQPGRSHQSERRGVFASGSPGPALRAVDTGHSSATKHSSSSSSSPVKHDVRSPSPQDAGRDGERAFFWSPPPGNRTAATDVQEDKERYARLDGSLSGKDAGSGYREQLYCLCRSVAFGDMVQCDHYRRRRVGSAFLAVGRQPAVCPYGEWFHFRCVGLTKKPKSVWYCPGCARAKANDAKRAKQSDKKSGTCGKAGGGSGSSGDCKVGGGGGGAASAVAAALDSADGDLQALEGTWGELTAGLRRWVGLFHRGTPLSSSLVFRPNHRPPTAQSISVTPPEAGGVAPTDLVLGNPPYFTLQTVEAPTAGGRARSLSAGQPAAGLVLTRARSSRHTAAEAAQILESAQVRAGVGGEGGVVDERKGGSGAWGGDGNAGGGVEKQSKKKKTSKKGKKGAKKAVKRAETTKVVVPPPSRHQYSYSLRIKK